MAAMDEFREEREAMKNAPFKEKFAYFWDYNKWFVIGGTVLLIVVTMWIYNIVTKKDVLLNGVLLNTLSSESDLVPLVDGFTELQEINTDKETFNFHVGLHYDPTNSSGYDGTTLQTLATWQGAEQIDFITAEIPTMTDLAYKGYFINLREYLPQDVIAQYEPYFLYMDEDFYIRRAEAINNGDTLEEFQTLPDATKPENMVNPIPIFIDVSKCDELLKAYGRTPDSLVLGVSQMSKHNKMTVDFLAYIMGQ